MRRSDALEVPGNVTKLLRDRSLAVGRLEVIVVREREGYG